MIPKKPSFDRDFYHLILPGWRKQIPIMVFLSNLKFQCFHTDLKKIIFSIAHTQNLNLLLPSLPCLANPSRATSQLSPSPWFQWNGFFSGFCEPSQAKSTHNMGWDEKQLHRKGIEVWRQKNRKASLTIWRRPHHFRRVEWWESTCSVSLPTISVQTSWTF